MQEAGAQLAHTVDEALLLLRDDLSVYLVSRDEHEAQQLAVSHASRVNHLVTADDDPADQECLLQMRWRQAQSKPATSLKPDWLVHCLSRLVLMSTVTYEHALPVTCV